VRHGFLLHAPRGSRWLCCFRLHHQRTKASCGTETLSDATPLAENHALRLAPFPLDAREEFPNLFATALEKIKDVIGAAVVWARVAAIGGDLQLHRVVIRPTSAASDNAIQRRLCSQQLEPAFYTAAYSDELRALEPSGGQVKEKVTVFHFSLTA
jgi:hypothetical protein